jgi:TRAP-type C4-dicarboxylate transport system permease small subunit
MKIHTDRSHRSIAVIDRIASGIERVSLFVSVMMGGSMVIIVIAGVIARYAMRNPFAWTEEASRFLMIWMVLIGMSVVTRNRENLCVEFLVIKFPLFLQRAVKLVNDLLILYFLYILTREGLVMAMNAKMQVVPSLGITMFYPLLCIPAGGLLTMTQLGLQILIDMLMWNSRISPHRVITEE